jgi:aryl-alcohol dehydrogenase-like predicted oxidoreductase
LGGIVVAGQAQADADRIVARAVERGVNYFDVAPTYADAEDRLGPALKPYRDRAFLACKTEKRTRAEADAALAQSLKRLRTDHFDLYQLHGLPNRAEAETCIASGGALETLIAARDKGYVRYLGFSAHSVEAALFCLDRFPFDSVLFPLSWPAYYTGRFGPQVIEAASQKGAAVLALKAMGRRPWPEGAERRYPNCWYEPFDKPDEAERALRWTLSLPVTAAIPPGDPGLFELALSIGEHFSPMTDAEIQALQSEAASMEPLFRSDSQHE